MNLASLYHNLTKSKRKEKEGGDALEEFFYYNVYFKEYSRLNKIPLPKPGDLKISLEKALLKRRSKREFNGKAVSLKDLSTLLFYSAGIIEKEENDWNKSKRTYPSAGARFPLEIYPIVLKGGDGLDAGIYHYNVKGHFLERLAKDDGLVKKIYPKIIWQEMIENASLLLVVSCSFWRVLIKYKERGYRYALIEAGHFGQNVYLVSEAVGLKCCAIGGFDDDEFTKLLDTYDEDEEVVYVFSFSR
jgi:SagB-type dehydrogenase family enzyme